MVDMGNSSEDLSGNRLDLREYKLAQKVKGWVKSEERLTWICMAASKSIKELARYSYMSTQAASPSKVSGTICW